VAECLVCSLRICMSQVQIRAETLFRHIISFTHNYSCQLSLSSFRGRQTSISFGWLSKSYCALVGLAISAVPNTLLSSYNLPTVWVVNLRVAIEKWELLSEQALSTRDSSPSTSKGITYNKLAYHNFSVSAANVRWWKRLRSVDGEDHRQVSSIGFVGDGHSSNVYNRTDSVLIASMCGSCKPSTTSSDRHMAACINLCTSRQHFLTFVSSVKEFTDFSEYFVIMFFTS